MNECVKEYNLWKDSFVKEMNRFSDFIERNEFRIQGDKAKEKELKLIARRINREERRLGRDRKRLLKSLNCPDAFHVYMKPHFTALRQIRGKIDLFIDAMYT